MPIFVSERPEALLRNNDFARPKGLGVVCHKMVSEALKKSYYCYSFCYSIGFYIVLFRTKNINIMFFFQVNPILTSDFVMQTFAFEHFAEISTAEDLVEPRLGARFRLLPGGEDEKLLGEKRRGAEADAFSPSD